MSAEFNHPCKNTCSGWQQGYDIGFKEKETRFKLALQMADINLKDAIHLLSLRDLRIKNLRKVIRDVADMPTGDVIDSATYIQTLLAEALKADDEAMKKYG